MAGSEQMTHAQRAVRIRVLNDQFRKTLLGGKLFLTPGIVEAAQGDVGELLRMIARFNAFDEDNDPHGEHDFGSLHWQAEQVYWKIDYYDADCCYGSPDPANARLTTRVMTVMLAHEY